MPFMKVLLFVSFLRVMFIYSAGNLALQDSYTSISTTLFPNTLKVIEGFMLVNVKRSIKFNILSNKEHVEM